MKSHVLNSLTKVILVLLSLFTLISCSDDSENKKIESEHKSHQNKIIYFDKNNDGIKKDNIKKTLKKVIQKTSHKKINQADWSSIKEQGSLRIIVPYSLQHNEFLPRESLSYNHELNLIIRFCEENNLTPVFISTKYFSNMLPLLEQGMGDIVVANLTITDSRKEQINFTIPVDHSTEQLVVSQTYNQILSIDKLNGLKIGVRENTSFWDTLSALKEQQPDIKIVKLDDNLSADDKFNHIISGKINAVVEDSNQFAFLKKYRSDVKMILDLGKERPIAWAVRKNNPILLKQLNRYIKTEKLLQHLPESRLGDLDSIKKHRQLRLITRNNASTYFLWKNQLMGFEYELIRQFAQQHKVNIKVLVANDFKQMLEWLKQGYGDIISAGLIKNPERARLPVEFTDPYLFVQEVIVQRKNESAIKSLYDLEQRTFYVRKSSSYLETLQKIQDQLRSENINFSIEIVPETMETEEIIKHVIDGKYDLTLSDSHIIAIEESWHSELNATLPLTGEQGHRWLIRKTDSKLLAELNKFIKKEYKSLFYNITYNKYFKNSRKLFDADKREKNNTSISQYDELIKSLAQEYHFDWRLVAAQVNQESQFNPKAKSWAGAKGLLQVMPRTAREVAVSNLEKPQNGLRAGLKYMTWISKQLSGDLPADVQVWFTLAAYNAGLGHLKDARILAVKQGLNPDRWFGHVDKAFLLLSRPKYHKTARYGYVRGSEPVKYVKNIQALYELYSKKHPNEAQM